MKKKLIWLLVPILLVAISAIVTVAYLATTDSERNSVTVGDASIELVEFERADVNGNKTDAIVPFDGDDKVLLPTTLKGGLTYANPDYKTPPDDNYENYVVWNKDENGDEIKVGGKTDYKTPIWNPDNITYELDKMVFVRNTGNTNVYVRICFAFEAGNYVYKSHFERMVHLNKNETDWTWEWYNNGKVVEMNGTRYYIVWATYNHVLPGGEYTRISLSQIALDTSAINDHVNAFYGNYEVKAFAQGIQADGFEGIGGLVDGAPAPSKDAPAALNKGFGDELPFRNVKDVTFTKLSTAIHRLNGEEGGEDITSKVTSVTFGLTKDHADKVKGYDGVMVANLESKVDDDDNVTTAEADFTAYAYYVPNGENYDIYVLADDWKIYTPNNSGGLFQGMKALTKVETSNLNVSATTNMAHMFHDAGIIQLDVSDWDVSNVTNMEQMFAACRKLTSLDCSRWKVDNVTRMNNMFHCCDVVESLYLSDWNVSKVTTMYYMFSACGKLSYLDVSGWNFGDNDTVSVKDMGSMFNSCSNLEYIDVANWNVSKVKDMSGTFVGCGALKSLDVSRWNVGNVITMNQMFSNCRNLASLDLSKWNVSNVKRMASMFQNASKLTKLDLSSWNTANVRDSKSMFDGCSGLTTIYVSDSWTMSQVKYEYISNTDHYSSENMFKNCSKLVGGNNTVYNASYVDKTYAIIDGGKLFDENGNLISESAPGYLTKK